MRKNFIYLLLTFVLISCGKSGGGSNSDCDMVCEAHDFTLSTTPDGAVPNEALTFETNVALVNFDHSQTAKVLEAADLIKQVIATEEFKNKVLNHSYNGKKTFVDNNGLSNLQIYNRILLGAEKLRPAKNNALDVELELYYQDSSTIGYTYASSNRIWMNTKFFNGFTPVKVSSNLMHEWLHKLGFGHDSEATASRPYSVPYAIGYIVRDMANRL